MTRGRAALETALVVLLLVFGASLGSFASRHFIGEPAFYQESFGPAVMVATGRGFVNPLQAPGSPLDDFLARRRMTLNAGDVAGVLTGPPDHFQQATRYLMLATGYVWKISGISWAAVSNVSALLCALYVVASYAVCRVWLQPALAVGGAVLMGLSPLQLQQVVQVRDYSKGPFILFAIALTIAVASRPLSRRALLLMSAACGIAIGIGLGFRMDVLVMAPIFLASLALFRDRRPWTGLADKGLAAGAFLLAIFVSAAPVLFHLSEGSNGFHVIFLGEAEPFDAELGLARSAYTQLPFYDDYYAASVVREYAWRETGARPPDYGSTAYDTEGRAYWLQIVRHFPADVLARALGATNSVLNLPFSTPPLNFLTPPIDGTSRLASLLTNQRPHRARIDAVFDWLAALNGWGIAFGAVLVGAAAAQSTRLGVFTGWMMMLTAGYASLQYADRHVFHLQIIPILGLLVAIGLVFRAPWLDRRVMRRFGWALVALTLAVAAPLMVLRAYQTAHLAGLFREYINAPKEVVSSALEDTGHGTWRVHLDLAPPMPGGHRPAGYYVVEFDGAPARQMTPIEVRYAPSAAGLDYSRTVAVTETAGISRVFIPGYGQFPAWAFDGLELPAELKGRLRGIYRISPAAHPSLLLDLRLPGGWEQRGLYQTFRGEPGSARDDVRVFNRFDGAVSNVAWMTRLDSPQATPRADAIAESYTKAAGVTAAGVEMDGVAESQSGYLVAFKPVDVAGPAALVVRGHLYAGGLTVGLLLNKQWSGSVTVQQPGDFVAVVNIPRPGTFEPIVTNATRRDRAPNHFVLSRFGVVTSEATTEAAGR